MIVIVTGASKGIGFELMKQFSKTDFLVLAVSRKVDSIKSYIEKENAYNVMPVRADITKASDRKKILGVCKKINEPVRILVNNAGSLIKKSFDKITDKELTSVYNTNVFAPFLLSQELLPVLGKKVKSHIINITSMGGFQGSSKFGGLTAYSSSKAALSGLTECMAEELKEKNISVNALAIGAVETEMLRKAFPGYKAPLKSAEMAEYIFEFALNGNKYYNGKILPVSVSTP